MRWRGRLRGPGGKPTGLGEKMSYWAWNDPGLAWSVLWVIRRFWGRGLNGVPYYWKPGGAQPAQKEATSSARRLRLETPLMYQPLAPRASASICLRQS